MSQLPNLQVDKFEIRAAVQNGSVILRWQGETTMRTPASFITPYLNTVIAAATGKLIVMDFCGVTFMNSSTLLPIIAFVKAMADAALPAQLRYNEAISWQRVSYHSMTVMCKKMPTIQVVYAPEPTA